MEGFLLTWADALGKKKQNKQSRLSELCPFLLHAAHEELPDGKTFVLEIPGESVGVTKF